MDKDQLTVFEKLKNLTILQDLSKQDRIERLRAIIKHTAEYNYIGYKLNLAEAARAQKKIRLPQSRLKTIFC